MSKDKIFTALATVGMLLIVAGVILPFFKGLGFTPFKYLYASGALVVLVARLFSQYDGPDLRLRRLCRIEVWSAIFFCVAAFFLFYPPSYDCNFRDVLAFTLAGGVIQIYTSIAIPMRRSHLGDDQR